MEDKNIVTHLSESRQFSRASLKNFCGDQFHVFKVIASPGVTKLEGP